MDSIPPELIERLRQSGIRIDREGNFWHEGAEVTHEGLKHALFRWLGELPDGRVVLRLDEQRFAYVDVEDTPLVVRTARWQDDALMLSLSDGSEEPLNVQTLSIDDGGILRVRVRGAKLSARLATSAATVLAENMSDTSPPQLRIAGHVHTLRTPPGHKT